MPGIIEILDTTLRDGEQSPGVNLCPEEKLEIARNLEKLKVDIIEGGFPITSAGDLQAIKLISENVKEPVIAALARTRQEDIDTAWESLEKARRPRIHTFIATSDIHLKYKLNKTREEVLEMAEAGVKYAKKYVEDVQFSAEDASRSDLDFLCQVIERVIQAGATVINVPDTVGYQVPQQFGQLIERIREKVPATDKITLSVHCHNDLGLALANSLAAIEKGVTQVECTINGIGERAGNTAMEELVMTLATRADFYQYYSTNINQKNIFRTSRLVSKLTNMLVQANKAVVGRNAFAHESGIHQDGVLKEKSTYEIMKPESIGLLDNRIVLGKHSGRHAFKIKLKEMGFEKLSEEELQKLFERFKDLVDKRQIVSEHEMEAIIEEELRKVPEYYQLSYFQIFTGNKFRPTATVGIIRGGELIEEAACGGGPVDAMYRTIDRLTGIQTKLMDYSIKAVTGGRDALGEVNIRLTDNGNIISGRGVSTDILEASVKAYINAINKIVKKRGGLYGDDRGGEDNCQSRRQG